MTCLPGTPRSPTWRGTRGRSSSSWAGRTSRSRSAARRRSAARSRSRPRPTARTGSAMPSSRSRPWRSRRAPRPELIVEEARRRPGELTLVTLGPYDQPRPGAGAGAGPAAAAPPLGLDGRRVPGPGQHDAGERVERPLRPRGRPARLRRVAGGDRPRPVATPRALALGLDVTERARLGTDHVVALARRAGRTPDDSLDPTREPGDPSGGASRATRSYASSPTRSAGTSSSTPATTGSMARSSTTRSSSPRRSTRRSSRPRPWPSTSTPPAASGTARRSPTGAACGVVARTPTSR